MDGLGNLGFKLLVSMVVGIGLSAGSRAAEVDGLECIRVPVEPGSPLRLALRHRPPASAAQRRAVSPVLFLHGETFPSALAADYPLRGRSWMMDLAAAGFDVWALDFLGYGDADRYPELAEPAAGRAPLGRAPAAARQIAAAVEQVLRRTGAARLSLVAHSWGTIPAARFAAEQGETVDRLVLFGPLAARAPRSQDPPPQDPEPGRAHHEVGRDDQWASFSAGVPAGASPPITEAEFAAWVAAYLATDPESAWRSPPAVRVPFGPMADANEADLGAQGYDPAAVRVPTLLIRGEWDVASTDADARALFERLGAPLRRLVVLSHGTHRMHLEAGRFQLFREVQTFLEAGDGEAP